MLSFADLTAWRIILGLSLMCVGGLVLWAYGMRRKETVIAVGGPEAEATRNFHHHLSRWFLLYGLLISLIGGALLVWAGSVFI